MFKKISETNPENNQICIVYHDDGSYVPHIYIYGEACEEEKRIAMWFDDFGDGYEVYEGDTWIPCPTKSDLNNSEGVA